MSKFKLLPLVTILNTNYDWEGLYVGSKLKEQGHSISTVQALRIVQGLGKFNIQVLTVNENWFKELGSLPDDLGYASIED